MKIRSQLLLSNGVILGILLLVVTIMYQSVSSLVESATWVHHTQEVMAKARQLAKFTVDMETGQRGFVLTGTQEFLESFIEGQQGFTNTIKTVATQVVDNPAQVERIERLRRMTDDWVEYSGHREIELRRKVDRGEIQYIFMANVLRGLTEDGEPIPTYQKTGKQRMDEIREVIDEFVGVEEKLLAHRDSENRQVARAAQKVALFGVLLATLLAALVGVYLSGVITRQLGAEPGELRGVSEKVASGILSEKLALGGNDGVESVAVHINRVIETLRYAAEKADEIARGDFESEIVLRGEQDELGIALRRMMQTLREATLLNERQHWIKNGQNKLAKVVSGEQELGLLSRRIVTQVARYTGAKLGALYTLSEESFQLTGSYAFHHDKRIEPAFDLGQGLVGQAALGKETLVLDQVPADYVQITSALGSAAPVHLVVMPLIHDSRVLGVMELGSLRPFDSGALDLLKLIAPSAAVAIHSSRERDKMTKLLAETRRQAADMERQKAVLQDQKRQLDQSGKYKSEFLSNMSHELRTPLNSMLILSRNLAANENGNLTHDQVTAAQVVVSGGEELLELINDILDMSKIEAGHMETTNERIDLRDLAEGLKQQFAPLAEQKKIDLELGFGDGVSNFICSDAQRVRQILKNLLSNAIKFTEKGCVTLLLEPVDNNRPSALAKAEGVLAIRVRDTGIGIPEHRWSAIFEPFQQVNGSTSRKYGGTGLGLSISRQLTSLLGGELELDSSDGSGSNFSLYLPTSASDADSPEEPSSHEASKQQGQTRDSDNPRLAQVTPVDTRLAIVETIRGQKLLLVDDDTRNLLALSKVLADAGMLIDCATDGKLAIQKLKTSGDIAIVVMDIVMPVMDGLEAIRRIRAMGRFENLPIITLSARAMAENKRECLDAGADRFLPKPVDTDELLQTIDVLLRASADNRILRKTG